MDRRRLVVGADVGRPGARPRLHPDQRRDHRLLRRLPARRQPVQHERHRARREDRQARLAPAAGQARHLELRHADRADAARRQRRRPAHPGRVPDHQAGVGLLLQPPDRRADLADRRCGRRRSRRCPARSWRRRSPSSTKPAPFDLQGRTEDAPHRLHARRSRSWRSSGPRQRDLLAPLFAPPRHRGNAEGKGPANICPGGGGGANITGPPAADPASGIIFITSTSGCSPTLLAPAKERDNDKMTGKTLAQWATARGGRRRRRRSPTPNDPLCGHPRPLQGPARPHRRHRHEHRRASVDDPARRHGREGSRRRSATTRCSRA